jgi:hypothetical protein
MDNKVKFKKIFNEVDYRDIIPDQPFGKSKDINKLKTKSVTGDKVSHLAARADVTVDRIKDNLRSMGVSAPDLTDQNTIDFYIALKEFDFSFSLNKPIRDFFNNQNENIKGRASVDKRSKPKKFVIYFTHFVKNMGGDFVKNAVYRIDFYEETLNKNLRGTEINLPMLVKNGVYKVKIRKIKSYDVKEGSISLGDVLQDILLEKTTDVNWGGDENLPKHFDRSLKIISVPSFVEPKTEKQEKTDGVYEISPKSSIDGVTTTGKTNWVSDTIVSILNKEFNGGRVLVKKSLSKKDTLILYYPGIKKKLGTDAILITKDDILDLFFGKKIKRAKVKIGPKAAGFDEFEEEGEAFITLLPN